MGSALRSWCDSAGPGAMALQEVLWNWGCSDTNARLLGGDVLRPSDEKPGVLSLGSSFDGQGEKTRYLKD